MNIPIIRMEIQGLKHNIAMMISEHQLKLDEHVKDAVDQYCTDENIKKVVMEATINALNQVMKEETESFFKYGEGRKAISESVKSILNLSIGSKE